MLLMNCPYFECQKMFFDFDGFGLYRRSDEKNFRLLYGNTDTFVRTEASGPPKQSRITLAL